jgi:Tfp pilus assembly protein PilO
MKELFDLLDSKERRILVVLCVLLVSVLILHSGFALKQKKMYFRSLDTLSSQQTELELLKKRSRDKKREWLKWEEARKDVLEIEEEYFYKEDRNVNELRVDLMKIFLQSGIRVTSELRFDYAEAREEDMKIARVKFSLTGTYFDLKKFIHQVEIYPKFLMIDNIDFVDIDTQTGSMELNVELAGFYEN